MPVNAQRETFLNFDPLYIGTVEYQALMKKTQFLYVAICFGYRDVFNQRYWVVSSGVYDLGNKVFKVIDGVGHNCNGIYREEEWQGQPKQ